MVGFKNFGVVAFSGAVFLAGCTNPDGTNNNTGTGVGVGAALGALVGSAVADNDTRGAVVGGIVGAAIGGAIGADLDRQEAEMRAALGSDVQIVNNGNQLIVSLPESITFPTNSAVVKSSLQSDLLELATIMNNYPNTTIEVVGHTDNTGTVDYNQALSEQRARAVRGILLSGGVNGSRIVAYGAGETRPIASNADPAGRQANRRVEIYITPNG